MLPLFRPKVASVLANIPDGQPLLFNSTVAEVVTNVVLATPTGYYHLLGPEVTIGPHSVLGTPIAIHTW